MRNNTLSALYQENSDELMNIIDHKPTWLIRWGNVLFLIITIILISLGWFIQFADVIVTPITITNTLFPKTVVLKNTSKIEKLLVKDNDSVKEDQMLALLESTANPEQVIKLYDVLQKNHTTISKRAELISMLKPLDQLGEVQGAYQTFEILNTQYKAFNSGYYQTKIKMIKTELVNLNLLVTQIHEQKALLFRDYEISKKEHLMNYKFMQEKIISKLDYEHSESKLLMKELQVKQLEQSLTNIKTQFVDKQREILDINRQSYELESNLLQAFNTLYSVVSKWKRDYALFSPSDGKVNFSISLQEKQNISAGQEVMYILPHGGNYFALAKIGQNNLGKIKYNQKVIIKLDAYPFNEYGIIEGKILEVSNVPTKDNKYFAKIYLNNGLISSYKYKLLPKQGMNGTGEIITDELTILQRLFSKIRKLIRQPY